MTMSLPIIFLAGLGTFLTPCVLPLIPIYLGALSGFGVEEAQEQGWRGRLKMVGGSLSFVLGFTVVFVALGLASSLFGRALADHRQLLTQLGGLLVFVFGLKFMGFLKLDFLEREARLKMPEAGGFFGNVAFGVVFALGWTPCIGPVLGSVLTYTASAATSPWMGALYLLAYAAGFAVPLLAVAFLLGTAVSLMDKLKKHMQKIQTVGGAALVLVGVVLITGKAAWITGGTAEAGPRGERCEDLTKSGKPTVVQFKSPDCVICKEMEPVVNRLRNDCAGSQARIREVVVADSGKSPLVKKHRVVGYPTFIFFNSKGEEVARLVGRQKLQSLRQHLTLITGQSCPYIGGPEGRGPPKDAHPGHGLDESATRAKPRGSGSGGGGSCGEGDTGAEGAFCD